VLLAAALFAASVSLYRSGTLRFNYPSEARFPVRGIDVSHHQAVVDWSAVRSAGIEFAFIKATEGGDHSDTRFATNWEEAGLAGIARGAYHFFTFCTPGRVQAEHFLATIGPQAGELPLAADVEFSGNCASWTNIDEIRREFRVFLAFVEEGTGRPPLIYVTPESFQRIIKGHFDGHPTWLRNLWFEPSTRRYGVWRFWQYADNARLPGIEGPVDLNTFCCARDEFSTRR
jgi:lysozyme